MKTSECWCCSGSGLEDDAFEMGPVTCTVCGGSGTLKLPKKKKPTDRERRIREVSDEIWSFLGAYRRHEPAKSLTAEDWAEVLGPIVDSLTLERFEVRRFEWSE